MHSDYGIALDERDMWDFGNDFARNAVGFGVDNGSTSHADNRKNYFLVLGEGLSYSINGSFGSPKKKININFNKANTKFCLSLHYTGDKSSLFVNGNEIFSLKLMMKISTFQLNFV